MSKYLHTCNFDVDVLKQQLRTKTTRIQVRPKTFQLLLYFLQHPQQLLSKQQLLKAVWDDVEVSEQVLFQTVREIRHLFGSQQVISTQPRKGYIWLAEVTELTNQTKPAPQQTNKITDKVTHYLLASLLIGICLISIALWQQTKPETVTGSLVVLPTKSQIPDDQHNWVPLGLMSQLISQFQSTERLAVLQPEQVLNLLSTIALPKHYSDMQLHRLFDISGANLIVETELIGNVQDYKLKYHLHFRNDIKRGVIFADSVNAASQQLGDILTPYLGKRVGKDSKLTSTEFSNELMLKAIEQREQGNYQDSNGFLAALIVSEPKHVMAHRIMAMNNIALGKLESAKALLQQAHQLLLSDSTKLIPQELPALHYFQAVIEFIKNDQDSALRLLALTEQSAKHHSNWIYLAFSQQLQGKIHLKSNKLNLAFEAFNEAYQSHSVIQCPAGKSQSLMSLSRVAKRSGKQSLALDYLQQAEQLISTRKLDHLITDLQFVKKKVI